MYDDDSHVKIQIQKSSSQDPQFVSINIEPGMNYEDLLEIVSSKENVSAAEYCFYTESDGIFKRIRMGDIVQPTSKLGVIHMKSAPFTIIFRHLGFNQKIKVVPRDRSSDLRRKFAEEANEMVSEAVILSFRGRKIEEDENMDSCGVIEACVDSLKSKSNDSVFVDGFVKIWVEDKSVGTNTALEISPFETIEEVLTKFCATESRGFVPESTLTVSGKKLESFERVFNANPPILNDSVVVFTAAPYNLEIRDDLEENEYDSWKKPRVMQKVEDHWTVRRLREEYSRRPDAKMLSENDRFFLKETALDEETQLYRLGLGEGGVLLIRRAQVEPSNLYYCADCGAENSLKPRDAVRCKLCFFRIVFKKRTPKICQYNCR